jgi:hypothetical protein
MTDETKQPETAVAPVEGNNEAQVQVALEYNIDAFLIKRSEFIEKVNAIMVDGKDYHIIQNKKSMAKGGAEKIASIFNWQAAFKKDTESLEMFGDAVKGTVAFICTLTKDESFIGEGRGAAMLSKNAGDPNKTIKMAQKSAFIDAVLRASGLSDFFTQDLEDMNLPPQQPERRTYNPQRQVYKPQQSQRPTIDAKEVIIRQLSQLGYDPKRLMESRESAETAIMIEVGIPLLGTPANLKEIVDALTIKLKANKPQNAPQTKVETRQGEWMNKAVQATVEATPAPQEQRLERISQPQLNLLTSMIEQKLKTPKTDPNRQAQDLKYFYSGAFPWLNKIDKLTDLSADEARDLNNYLVHQPTID